MSGSQDAAETTSVGNTTDDDDFNTTSTLSGSSSFECDTPRTVSKKQKQLAKKKSKRAKNKQRNEKKKKEKNKITKGDFFSRSAEFKVWLQEEKCLDQESLPELKARDLFKKFVKKWNSKKLPVKYYRGTECWAATASPSTQSLWAMPLDKDVNVTPGSVKEEDLVSLYSRTPKQASFSTFGRGEGKRLIEQLRSMQSEKEMRNSNGSDETNTLQKKRSLQHPRTPRFLSVYVPLDHSTIRSTQVSPPRRVASLHSISISDAPPLPPPPLPPMRASSLQHLPTEDPPKPRPIQPARSLQSYKPTIPKTIPPTSKQPAPPRMMPALSHTCLPPPPPTYIPSGSYSSLPPPPEEFLPDLVNFIRPTSGFNSLRGQSKRSSIRADLPVVPIPVWSDFKGESDGGYETLPAFKDGTANTRNSVPVLPGARRRTSSVSSVAPSIVSSMTSCTAISMVDEDADAKDETVVESLYAKVDFSKKTKGMCKLESTDETPIPPAMPQPLPKETIKEIYAEQSTTRKANDKKEKKDKKKVKKEKKCDTKKNVTDKKKTKKKEFTSNCGTSAPPAPPPPPPINTRPLPSVPCNEKDKPKQNAHGNVKSKMVDETIPAPPPPPPPPPPLPKEPSTRSRALPSLPSTQHQCKPPPARHPFQMRNTVTKAPTLELEKPSRPKSALIPPRATMLTPTAHIQQNKIDIQNLTIPKYNGPPAEPKVEEKVHQTTPKSLSDCQPVDILQFLSPEKPPADQQAASPKRKLSSSKENMSKDIRTSVEDKRRKVTKQDSYAARLAWTSPVILQRLAKATGPRSTPRNQIPTQPKSTRVTHL